MKPVTTYHVSLELQMTFLGMAATVILTITMKTFVLFFSVLVTLVLASPWTNSNSGALEFPS